MLCDRGTMDGKAYSSSQGWAEVLAAQGNDELELRDSRYNAVLPSPSTSPRPPTGGGN